MATVERLILWDIDGTLVRAGAVAREAFGRAIARVLDRVEAEIEFVPMSGKTDPQIAREMLALAEAADHEQHVPAVIAHLEAELAEAEALLRANGRVLPGIDTLLPALAGDPAFHQSVLTGNTAANAAAKLAAFGLTRWIDVETGAFGSDHHDRNELVPIAVERASQLRGVDVARDQVWVIGDTPHDLACARAGGARCVLAATGRIGLEELEATDADAVFPDLSDTAAVLDVLRS